MYRLSFVEQVQSPVFFGSLSGALTRVDAARGEGNLTAVKAIVKGAAYHRTGVAGGVVGLGGAKSDEQKRVCLVGFLSVLVFLCVLSVLCVIGADDILASFTHTPQRQEVRCLCDMGQAFAINECGVFRNGFPPTIYTLDGVSGLLCEFLELGRTPPRVYSCPPPAVRARKSVYN